MFSNRVFFFFFSSRRRHTRCREVSWARRCVQETGINAEYMGTERVITFTVKQPKSVKWTEETKDNEGQQKKKSKLCCIFRKPLEDPDEEFSSSSDEDLPNAYERLPKQQRKKPKDTTKQQPYIILPISCLLYTSPSPRDLSTSRMPSSA
eukprot:TRINITY_DN10685_c0_g1_i3.p3 TRINITY_DN10685_c0_g1~~TRINITY_DN10685_c0_g1_i3.p3  ORF type:complete len:150 (-),score=53.42 TRINITY_DN10685_c0_g1_i3:130-579(-)